MRITLKALFNPVNAATQQLRDFQNRGTAYQPSYMGFGVVSARNSALGTVSVKLSPFGVIKADLQVLSREWAGGTATAGHGERSLPPEGALVVVVFTDADQNEGIVIGSVLMPWGDSAMNRGQKATGLLATGKEDEVLVKTPDGHTFTQNRSTKAITFDHSTGAQIKITATGSIEVTPSASGSIKLAGGTIPCNDLQLCLFAAVAHGIGTATKVYVP